MSRSTSTKGKSPDVGGEQTRAALAAQEKYLACERRKLPPGITLEELLDYEYRRGAQLAVLVTDDAERRRLIDKCRKAQHGQGD